MNAVVRATRRAAGTLLGLAMAAIVAGCASPANQKAMTVQGIPPAAKQHPYAVSVVASGGSETGAMDSSNIANTDLKAAVENSIKESRVFREVVSGKQGQYELGVTVIQLTKPVFGFSFTVEMEAGWTLTRLEGGQVVLRKIIKSSHTATMSDAFAGVERLRLAVEGAARENIRQGITAVSALDL